MSHLILLLNTIFVSPHFASTILTALPMSLVSPLRQLSWLLALKKRFQRLRFLLLKELKLPLMMQKQQVTRVLFTLLSLLDFLLPAILLA